MGCRVAHKGICAAWQYHYHGLMGQGISAISKRAPDAGD
jgi:hypothetical protein